MGKIKKDFSCYIPRNPNIEKIDRDEILMGGVRSLNVPGYRTYKFAYRMKMTRVTEPDYKSGTPVTKGFLNCYLDGFVFFPDVEPGFSEELVQVIGHAALGTAGEAVFSFLGEGFSKLFGELTMSPLSEMIFQKMENKRKMFQQALASKNFFFIPYAELTRVRKRKEQSFFGDKVMYIFSHETKAGDIFHYLLEEKTGYSGSSVESLDEKIIIKDRLEKEVEEIARGILKKQLNPFTESFFGKYADEYKNSTGERRKEITNEYKKQLNAAIVKLGYTPSVLDFDNLNYVTDKKLKSELLEKLSPSLPGYRKLPTEIVENFPISLYNLCNFS